VLLVTTAAALAPAAAQASSRTDRVAASNAFAQRTLTFFRKQQAADGRATAALTARRAAAQQCIGVFESSPAKARDELATVYFEYLSGALWTVDAPLYGSWIHDLRASRRIDRSPVLARAADALRIDYRFADLAYTAFPDACATATAWRDAGWSSDARPMAKFEQLIVAYDERAHERVLSDASRQIRRYSKFGDGIGGLGIDEVDARVHTHMGCDRVGELLFPGDYDECRRAR
jgi:hypothetical protein